MMPMICAVLVAGNCVAWHQRGTITFEAYWAKAIQGPKDANGNVLEPSPDNMINGYGAFFNGAGICAACRMCRIAQRLSYEKKTSAQCSCRVDDMRTFRAMQAPSGIEPFLSTAPAAPAPKRTATQVELDTDLPDCGAPETSPGACLNYASAREYKLQLAAGCTHEEVNLRRCHK